MPRVAAAAGKATDLGFVCAGEVGVDDAFADFFEDALEQPSSVLMSIVALALLIRL